jgi:hypothetical protein
VDKGRSSVGFGSGRCQIAVRITDICLFFVGFMDGSENEFGIGVFLPKVYTHCKLRELLPPSNFAQNVSIGTTIVLLLDVDVLELTITLDDQTPMICPLVQDHVRYPFYPSFWMLQPSSSFQLLPDLCF